MLILYIIIYYLLGIMCETQLYGLYLGGGGFILVSYMRNISISVTKVNSSRLLIDIILKLTRSWREVTIKKCSIFSQTVFQLEQVFYTAPQILHFIITLKEDNSVVNLTYLYNFIISKLNSML